MRGKTNSIRGTVETTVWSHGLEDDPWPHLIQVLERIATTLERLERLELFKE